VNFRELPDGSVAVGEGPRRLVVSRDGTRGLPRRKSTNRNLWLRMA